MIGSIIGGKRATDTYKECSEDIHNGIKWLAGIFKSFDSGGVEFVFPKNIYNFNSIFSFNKCHYIAFEYSDKNNNFNTNKMIELINDQFLINGIKIKTIEEIYDTILLELANGFLYKKKITRNIFKF